MWVFLLGMLFGMLLGPPLAVLALWLLRDVTPPILFAPSDWD
ncbi:MAG TPA: hypothetical protein VGH47_14255 [Xanthobacteraceae bacterium]